MKEWCFRHLENLRFSLRNVGAFAVGQQTRMSVWDHGFEGKPRNSANSASTPLKQKMISLEVELRVHLNLSCQFIASIIVRMKIRVTNAF